MNRPNGKCFVLQDQKRLLSIDSSIDNNIKLWNIETGELIEEMFSGIDYFSSVQLHGPDLLIATGTVETDDEDCDGSKFLIITASK